MFSSRGALAGAERKIGRLVIVWRFMSTDSHLRWVFESVDPNSSGAAGKITDLFRNEEVEQRGHLVEDAPTAGATLMAREVIQNSWDAALELRESDPGLEPFAIDFDYETATGDEKKTLAGSLRLNQLAAHAAKVAPTPDDRTKLGLGTGSSLIDLESAELSCWRIVEHGASGMYGPWTGANSRMYVAMLAIGFHEKTEGAGGTFGYGKAGLIRASHSRVVVAYSCFRARDNDPGITRRLLGVTYWGPHKCDGISLTGFARFGDTSSESDVAAFPFVNECADEIASSLGFDVRHPNEPTQLGTSFLVIDPVVEPDELLTAIERNWWPAILDHRFTVTVTKPDGTARICRPLQNEQLKAFVDTYNHAESGAPIGGGRPARLRDLKHYTPQGETTYELGKLALIADPSDWSFPDEDDSATNGDNRSLVALIRDPRMVVEYHLPGRDISRRTPYVCGVFIAHPDVNVLLAQTEPKAHDKWDTRASDDVNPVATKVATEIGKRIRDNVKEFQAELRPPVDQTGAVRLTRLNEKLQRLRNQEGTKPPPPPPGERPFSFRLDVRRDVSGDDLYLHGTVTVRLADGVQEPSLGARIRIALAIDEDGRRGETVQLRISPPEGFEALDGDGARFEGVVSEQPARFEISSQAYRSDWTGELLVSGERLAVTGSSSA